MCRIARSVGKSRRLYFNGRKKLYCFNRVVVIVHDGLLIYVATGYEGIFPDAKVIRVTELAINWRENFTTDPESSHPLD